jgi:hypothetical protein
MARRCKADMPELSSNSHLAQPVDSTRLSTVRALPALSQSAHGDHVKEALDTLHRPSCMHGSHPSKRVEADVHRLLEERP